MKPLYTLLGISCILIITLVTLLRVGSVRFWPISPGAVSVEKVQIKGAPYLYVTGNAANKIAQVQGISLTCDITKKRFTIKQYRMFWSPFSSLEINDEWPVVYPLNSLPAGQYEVVYNAPEGQIVAGLIQIP
jgi:hypothetical protein